MRIEDCNAHRSGLDQRLEVRPRAPLVAVGTGIGDRDRGLDCEQHQHLLVLVGEFFAAFLVSQEEVPDIEAAVAHRCALEGAARDQVRREPERADVVPQVRQAERRIEAAQMFEQLHRVGPGCQLLLVLGRQAGDYELLRPARLVDGRDQAGDALAQRFDFRRGPVAVRH